MKVFKVQLNEFPGPCVVKEQQSVIDLIEKVLPAMSAGDFFTVTVAEMSEEVYENLLEFEEGDVY